MAKLDLDAGNVREIDVSHDDLRGYLYGKSLPEELETALDSALGDASQASPQYVVIRIA